MDAELESLEKFITIKAIYLGQFCENIEHQHMKYAWKECQDISIQKSKIVAVYPMSVWIKRGVLSNPSSMAALLGVDTEPNVQKKLLTYLLSPSIDGKPLMIISTTESQ